MSSEKRCDCRICKRNNEFINNVRLIEDSKVRKYFEDVLSELLNAEFDAETYGARNYTLVEFLKSKNLIDEFRLWKDENNKF